MYYYRNRWYDPEVGRFISEDPIGFAGDDVNLYVYVGNNPLSFIDPFGFWRCSSNDPPGSSGWWDAVQGALDVAGLAPGVGIIADLTNAGISVARGNYGDAALSMAAAVPIVGAAAGVGKLARTASKAVVIGEGMGAVKATAKALQAQGINAKWYQAWSKNFPTGRQMTPSELEAALSRNKRWINSKINQNYKIYDIGPRGDQLTSPFYRLEKEIIKQRNYPTMYIGR